MQIIVLTHAEARDPAVLQNVQKFLEAQGTNSATHVHASQETGKVTVTSIGDDAPDVGMPNPKEVFGRDGDLAAQVFGANAVPPLPAGVHSFVDAEVLQTAPAAQVAPVGATHLAAPSLPAANPAPEASALTAPATQTSPANGVVVDKDGLPWDGRIHASTKGTNQDGRWKAKRNVPEELVAQVTAELRAAMGVIAPQQQVAAAPVAPATQPIPTAVTAPVIQSVPVVVPAPPLTLAATPEAALATSVMPVAQVAALVAAPVAMPAPVAAAPLVAPVAPAAAAPTSETFPQFMARMAPYTQQGLITPEMIGAVTAQLGLGLPMLQNRPDMIPAFAQALGMPATPQ